MIPYGRQDISDEDVNNVIKVLNSDYLTTGPNVNEFEDNFSKYIKCKHSIAVNSGTSALDIALSSLGIKKGMEVITTAFTFVATSNCILYNNLKPKFADIDYSFNINPDSIRKKITNKTKAIIYVDYAGNPCNIKEIKNIADEYDLYLIEDAAHACGAESNGSKIGTFADVTTFSFHPVKNITTGEGGMVTTDNDDISNKLRLLRNHGINKEYNIRNQEQSYLYDIVTLGRNYRITDFQCALGSSQLKRLDAFIDKRTLIAERYKREINYPNQLIENNIKHAWHLFTILLNNKTERDSFFLYMKNNGVNVNVHYIPIYKFSYYKQFNFKPLKNTEDIFNRIVTLPIYPSLSEFDLNKIIDLTNKWKYCA